MTIRGGYRCDHCGIKLIVREQLRFDGEIDLVSDRNCTALDRIGKFCEPRTSGFKHYRAPSRYRIA